MNLNNARPYYPGDEMIVSLKATNSGGAPTVDLYIAVEALGRLFFFPAFDASATPWVGGVVVPEALDASVPVFSLIIAEGFPADQLKWIAAFTEAGTLQIISLDVEVAEIVSSSTKTPTPTRTQGPTNTQGPSRTPTPTNTPTSVPDIKMIHIPPGSFIMGSPPDETCRDDDEIQHEVKLTHGFCIQETEVTQELWNSISGKHFEYDDCGGNCPAESVSWFNCITFCNKLSQYKGYTPCYYSDESFAVVYTGIAEDKSAPFWNQSADGFRLPTEAEWEYAARAGATGPFGCECLDYPNSSCFDCSQKCLNDFAWFCGNSDASPHPAGELNANAFGLYDMHGNVWEWCWDRYGDYSGSATDPTGPLTGLPTGEGIRRGGCFYSGADNCRSANRDARSRYYHDCHIGLRLARSFIAAVDEPRKTRSAE